jgi:hypothetical protein
MSDFDDLKMAIRRNKLLGLWAAEHLGLTSAAAETYSSALATDTLDPDSRDVLAKLRKDFDAAGVAQSDHQILEAMNRLMIEAAKQMRTPQRGSLDGAAVALARNLSKR